MLRSLKILSIVLCFWMCIAPNKAMSGVQEDIPGEAQSMWDAYRDNLLALHAYQEGCEPTQVRPKAGSTYQGVIILLHGFTSCPKQFFQMANSFSELGFHVLIPTLPGHGRAGADKLQQQEALPGSKNWFVYGSFARWLNELARSVGEGQVHIGGLCLGATIAVHAMQLEPNLYSRGMLLSPYFEVSKPLIGRIGRMVGRIGDILNLETQLQHPIALQDNNICDNIERKIYGRAGYCKVRLTNLIAVSRYAYWIQQNWRPLETPVQTLLVEKDDVAHPQTTLKLLEQIHSPFDTESLICFLNKAVTHSMFSPTDLPLPKPWLPELHRALSEFFASGQSLRQSDKSGYIWPDSRTEVKSCALFPVAQAHGLTAYEPAE